MPVAGPSRRHRRDASSDGIEEDHPTQHNQDDVNNDDDEPVRKLRHGAKAVKSEKLKDKRKAEAKEDKNEADDSGEDPLKDLGDQPLDKAQAQKIFGYSQDWDMMRKTKHNQFYGIVKDVSTAFAEFAEEEKAEQLMAEMDVLMRNLIDTENELVSHTTLLHDLHQKVARGEEITDVVNRYTKGVRTKLADYKNKTSRQKYAKADEYAAFKQAIFEVQNPGIAMPPLTDLIPREDGDDSDDDDDDVQVGGVTQDYKCPLTLTILVDPLTSARCGHSFSAQPIKEYIGILGERKKCPAAGCRQTISLGDLKPNKELAKQAKDAARRERMLREADSDEEEVIE